jgi:hypothetical protein
LLCSISFDKNIFDAAEALSKEYFLENIRKIYLQAYYLYLFFSKIRIRMFIIRYPGFFQIIDLFYFDAIKSE